MKSIHKDQILALREEGFSYNEIQEKLGTIAYHLGTGQKEKTQARNRINRTQSKGSVLGTKLDKFSEILSYKTRRKLFLATRDFSKDLKNPQPRTQRSFTPDELLEKFAANNSRCFLTGREINLENSQSYSLDHLHPRSKGGENTLDNCNIVCKAANFAKSDLTLQEFQQLCLDVVNHFKLK
jgi:5-methylcytosine-specific restriction endonuclease McrA